MTNRIHIDARTGVIEVEGEKDFVETQLDKLLPLIEACGFGTMPAATETANVSHRENPSSAPEPANNANGDGQAKGAGARRQKRAMNKPPKGHSCADRIRALRDEGFFEEGKTPTQIVQGLKAKGFTHTTNQVSAAGANMHKRNDIQRTKTGNGPWQYYWDRV